MVDVALLTLIVTLALPIIAFLFRKRLLDALARVFAPRLLHWARSEFFVESDEEDGEGGRKRVLRPSPAATSILQAYMPVVVQTALKSIKFKAGGVLPVNPVTGQLDFMAPVLGKIASGKKVGIEDFLPLIMDKAMPFVEGMLGGLGKGASKPKTGVSEVEIGRVV